MVVGSSLTCESKQIILDEVMNYKFKIYFLNKHFIKYFHLKLKYINLEEIWGSTVSIVYYCTSHQTAADSVAKTAENEKHGVIIYLNPKSICHNSI